MNSDLFLSILAMDSYNRGYGQGVGGLSSGGSLGNAVISRQSDVRDGSAEVNAGFYAIAYNVSNVAGFSPESYGKLRGHNTKLTRVFMWADDLEEVKEGHGFAAAKPRRRSSLYEAGRACAWSQ